MSSDTIANLKEEYALLEKEMPELHIVAKTQGFISAFYERRQNPYHSRIKLTLTILEGYPTDKPIIDVEYPVIKGLKRKLESDLNEQCGLVLGQYGQVLAVFRKLVQFVNTNKFIPCWRELKQCTDLVAQVNVKNNVSTSSQTKQSTISFNELQGKVKLKLSHNKYFYSCSIQIDDGYPSTVQIADWGKACKLTMLDTNLPPKIEQMMTAQAQELVRKMQDGMPAEEAIRQSNPIREPTGYVRKQASKDVKERLTQEALKGLKKDTETLKVVSELRSVNAEAMHWNANIKAHDAKERKEARRQIKKITDNEIQTDLAKYEKEKQWQIEETLRMAGYNISNFDGSNPQPSLRTLVEFLIGRVWKLPEEKCPVCKRLSLPMDPKSLQLLYQKGGHASKSDKERKERKEAKLKRPVRTFCGCWYHYSCLNIFMTEPPFGAQCNRCGERVYHPDWPDSIQTLERAWAAKQSKIREIDDVAMAFL